VGTNSPEARMMAKRLGSAYIAFAKTGNPNNPNIPQWSSYNVAERQVMIFDNQTRLEKDPNAGLRLMWDQLAS
jgi:para-nitrobenzyl esterase